MHLNQKGQLSIFLAISLMIVITLLGFIVNVGLFVKAKINLQNAVDAAAFSGAAVQARQLSNIGYLNWEMRNNYKEWMYKYYVLGQLGLPNLRVDSAEEKTHFRLRPFRDEDSINPDSYDRYNLPTVCIHFGSESNVCEIFQIPGLPRFDNVDVPFPGIVDHHRAFLNTIIAEKSRDCSTRSALNFGTALIWAYGTRNGTFDDIPLVAGDRVGAWINSVELGMRMRNLEAIVNRPPVASPICLQGGDCTTLEDLEQESPAFPINERPMKAFLSAYKNLGGGAFKTSSDAGSDFATSFKLTEIAPTPFDPGENRLSTFLIPSGSTIGQSGIQASVKHYLDLQAMPVNLVTFFTTMVSTTDDAQITGDVTLKAEGECGGTRTALPVPGFIMGFAKNPEVMTYYSVKGEANFVGLFYPFRDRAGVTLQAYAVAKPFGGRIGPRLFDIRDNNTIHPRVDNKQFRSGPYVSGIEIPDESFKLGYPIPVTRDFWVTNVDQPIGGVPTSSANIPRFTIPNLLFEYENFADLSKQTLSESNTMQIIGITSSKSGSRTNSTGEFLGLYSRDQYDAFRDAGGVNNVVSDDTITADNINKSILKARMPTKYEALNYMIPHLELDAPAAPRLEQPNVVQPLDKPFSDEDIYTYQIYAPLYGEGTLFGDNVSAITTTINEYLSANSTAIESFITALREVSESIKATSADAGTRSDYTAAADVIYRQSDIDSPASGCEGEPPDNKQLSMAGKFNIFFGDSLTEICEILPLSPSLTKYFTDTAGENENFKTFHQSQYAINPELRESPESLMTGFYPGPRQGASADGLLSNPYSPRTDDLLAKRNIYSTKFIPMATVLNGSSCNTEPFPFCHMYYEDFSPGTIPSDMDEAVLRNSVDRASVSEFEPFHF